MEHNIKDELTRLLTLKFRDNNEEFLNEIENFPFDIFLNNQEACISLIKENHTKNNENNNAVSIVLPLNEHGNPFLSINWLKAAACFPWELDHVKHEFWFTICQQMHILTQLSQSSFYGSPLARKFLRTIARQHNLQDQHPYWNGQEYPNFKIYRFPIEPIQITEDLEADHYDFSEMDEEEFTELFYHILLAESLGLMEYKKRAHERKKQFTKDLTRASEANHVESKKQSIPMK